MFLATKRLWANRLLKIFEFIIPIKIFSRRLYKKFSNELMIPAVMLIVASIFVGYFVYFTVDEQKIATAEEITQYMDLNQCMSAAIPLYKEQLKGPITHFILYRLKDECDKVIQQSQQETQQILAIRNHQQKKGN